MNLPSLGLLPSLRVLKINEMDAVCTVGPEFFGTMERPFRSLEVLEFKDMIAWESWCFSFGNKEIDQPFPQLNKLKLFCCPKLVSKLPHQLSSLIELDIQFCPILEEAYSPCMACLPSLKKLGVLDCSLGLIRRISSAANLKALTKIFLRGMNSEFTYLNKDFLSSLRVVEVLEFASCDGLIWLWEENNAELGKSLARLRCLSVIKCANLQKLPDNMQWLTSLRELTIVNCPKIESLPKGMASCCSSLEKLIIRECGSVISFPEGAMLPPTLRTLKIQGCGKLERLPEGIIVINNGEVSSSSSSKNSAMMISNQLEELEIINCPSLKPLINNIRNKEFRMSLAASSNLKKLGIKNCGNVFDWLLEDGDGDDELGCGVHASSLEEIDIVGCNVNRITNLALLSCLKSLMLQNCKMIKSVPYQMHATVTSLQRLKLKNLSIESFPKEGLPLSLRYLSVSYCKKLKQPMAEWGLHKLTALNTLHIEGEIGSLQGMTFFPPSSDWSVLPPNLEKLEVTSQKDLVRLSNGLRNYPTSLLVLYMYNNRKLQFLPKEGFPPSIGYLYFKGCSQDLRCKLSSNGQYFPLIEHIPHVEFA